MHTAPGAPVETANTASVRHHREWFLQWLVYTIAVAAVAIVGLWGHAVWREYSGAVVERSRLMDGAARLIEERGTRTISATDIVLQRIAERASDGGMDWFRQPAGAAWLAEMAEALPSQGTLWLLDSAGDLKATSTAHPAPPHNFADREYFPMHRDAAAPYHVGPMVRGRILEDYYAFTLSRRIEGAAGSFVGVVVAAIETRALVQLSRTFQLPNAVAGIVRTDGALVFAEPVADVPGGNRRRAATLADLRGAAGEIDYLSAYDGVERRVAYRRFDQWPMVAFVGLPHANLWAGIRQEMLWPTMISAAALATVSAFGRLALGSMRREHVALELARQARDAAETADADKTRFLATISHDIRQPVQSLVLLHSMLANARPEQAARVHELMDQSLGSLRTILEELLDLSRLDMGAVQPNLGDVALSSLMLRLHGEYGLRAKEKGLELRVVAARLTVRTDPTLFERMLRNLIENALKYTPSGRILVGCRRRNGQAVVEIHDTGPGIPDEALQTIWREFHQLDNQERDLAKGLGLGLAIVRRLAAALGHDVSVASRLGRGSCFRITLARAAN